MTFYVCRVCVWCLLSECLSPSIDSVSLVLVCLVLVCLVGEFAVFKYIFSSIRGSRCAMSFNHPHRTLILFIDGLECTYDST